MSLITRPLIYDDLLQMPDDGKRYEIIGGELYVAAAPIRKHQRVSYRLIQQIGGFVDELGLGEVYFAPVDVRLGSTDIVQPDIIFIRNDRLHLYQGSVMDGSPDLIVEILSPSTRSLDLVRKAALYANAGVREYWVADPDALTLTINVLGEGMYDPIAATTRTAHSVLLPGLTIDLDTLFAGLE